MRKYKYNFKNYIYMKKIFILIMLFFSFIINTNANWYWNHAVSAPNPWHTTLSSLHWGWPNKWTWCDSDWDTNWGSPSFPYTWTRDYAVAKNNSSSTLIPNSDNEVEISWTTIRCLYWDWYTPTWSVSHYNWWTNQASQTVSYSVNDKWWSKIKKVVLQKRTSTNSPSFTSWSSWSSNEKTNDNINNNSFSTSYNYNWNNHTAYQFRIYVEDVAGNSNYYYSWNTTKFDFTNPWTSNITSNPIAWTDILATTSYNFAVTAWSDIWSPIVMVQWFFEDYNSCSNWWLNRSSTNSATLSINPNISKANADCDWNSSIWWRNYTFKITYVEDEAWNSIWTKNTSSSYWWVKSFTYDIYSNHNNITTKSFSSTDKSNLEDNNNIADWTPYTLPITLKDNYWNAIVPSSWISRKINFIFNTDNSLYINQYSKTWDAIFWATPKNTNFINRYSTWNNITTNFNDEEVSNIAQWIYNFKYKVYTPTSNAENTAIWKFTINNIKFNISSDLWNISNTLITNSNNIDFKFKPLYKATFNWEQKTYWFIEWIIQSWSINIQKNWSRNTTNNNLYLEFWKNPRIASTKVKIYTINPNQELKQWHKTNITYLKKLLNNFSISTTTTTKKNLDTKIVQIPWTTLENLQNYYLSTHFEYTIDSHTIVYNSSIIWRNNYWNNTTTNTTTQVWLKVLWKTYSKNQKDIKNNQNINDIHILWNLTKSKLKENVRKNIYSKILNVPNTWWQWWTNNDIDNFGWTTWNNSNKWIKLLNNKVLYFDLSSPITETTITTNGGTNSWKKTIIIKWWDLYIKWNIYNNSNSDILWIIVLKDKNWKWWNLYIDPDVTYIAAQIYVDKSILTAKDTDWDWEISSNEIFWINRDQSLVANQLYINWQIFSENTIWGSRKNPPICPYYDKASCDLEKAQKYDLNYLRRYFTYDSDNNWTKDKIANWWEYYYNWSEHNSYDNSYKYINYPVVIKYNPIVQITPPPLFGN